MDYQNDFLRDLYTRKVLRHAHTFCYACLRLMQVCVICVCMDLHQKKFDSPFSSSKLNFKISLSSQLSLRIYLKNNADVFKSITKN